MTRVSTFGFLPTSMHQSGDVPKGAGPFGTPLRADPQKALARIDQLLDRIRIEPAGTPRRKAALDSLLSYVNTIGGDVLDAIQLNQGLAVSQNGAGYINHELVSMGERPIGEPDGAAQNRIEAARLRPGLIMAGRGQLRISLDAFDNLAIRAARSVGVDTLGAWNVAFDGREAWRFANEPNGGASVRDFSVSKAGWSQPLEATMGEVVEGLRGSVPHGYVFEVDLDNVPEDARPRALAAARQLEALGARVEMKSDTAPTARQLLDDAQELARLGARASELLAKPSSALTDADRRELEELGAALNRR